MKLTKPLLFLTSTIIGAVSVGSTSLALTKHKPSQTERDVIALEDPEKIEEKELEPDKAPPTSPPSSGSSQQQPQGGGGDTDTGSEGEDGDVEQQDASESGTNDDDEDEEEEDEDASSSQEEEETNTNTQEQNPSPPEQAQDQPEKENKDLTKEDIEKSLIEIIKSLSEKKDFSLETASLYLLFQTSNEVAQLKSLIEKYQQLDNEQKAKAGNASAGTSTGTPSVGAAGSPGEGSGAVGNGAGTTPSQGADGA